MEAAELQALRFLAHGDLTKFGKRTGDWLTLNDLHEVHRANPFRPLMELARVMLEELNDGDC